MFKKILLAFLLVIFIVGCGKTNALQWAKATDKADNIAEARKYIDEGDYTKAESYVKNETGSEARIVYAECLMGEAKIDLAEIIKKLTDSSVTNNPILRIEPLVEDTDNRGKIIEAAEIFRQNMPSTTSDKILGTLSLLIGHVALVKEAYAPTSSFALANNNYAAGTATITLPAPFGTQTISEANVNTQFNTLTASAGGDPLNYIKRSFTLLGSIGSVPNEVKDAVSTINASISTMYTTYTTTTSVTVEGVPVNVNLSNYNVMPWSFAKALCGF